MTGISVRSTNSVKLDNVDDYLAPSQACVNPAFQPTTKLGDKKDETKTPVGKGSSSGDVIVPRRRRRVVRKKIIDSADSKPDGNAGTIQLSRPVSKPSSKQPNDPQKVVKASMADCLACSGCVTTAETVMMEERHSLKSLRKRLASSEAGNRRSRVITVSPNSWADLRRHWNLSDSQQHRLSSLGKVDEDKKDDTLTPCNDKGGDSNKRDEHFYLSRFTTLLSKILNVTMVVDGNVPLQWAWVDEAREFCEAYETNRRKAVMQDEPEIAAPLPSIAIDSSKTLYYQADGSSETRDNRDRPSAILPLISGSCPALVCLVEKTLTKLVPHLSQGMSPMSLVGTILKAKGNKNNTAAANSDEDMDCAMDGGEYQPVGNGWDHWAIMPCHDKKLEASRKDFARTENPGEQAVDLVISTQECVELVEEWIMSQDEPNEDRIRTLPRITVAEHLSSLPPSNVSTTMLEPNDLLRRSSRAKYNSPLLVTTPIIHSNNSNMSYSDINEKQKQMSFSSGGHANYIFHYASKHLFGCALENDVGAPQLEWKAASLATKNVRSARLAKVLKQQHYYEAKLYRRRDGSFGTTPMSPSGVENGEKSSEVVLHFAIAHGMQTMQRALKQVVPMHNSTKSSTLHYLEAMACPHGCVNGGGSARLSTSTDTEPSANLIRETPTETRQRVQSTLEYLELSPFDPCKSLTAKLPRTGYHVVPPMNYTTGAVAGVRVDNMIW